MNAMTLKLNLCLLTAILTFSLGGAAYALDTTCESVYKNDFTAGLLSQGNPGLIDINYNCGSVCAINIIQSIKNTLGEAPIENPDKIFNELYYDTPEIRRGLSPAALDRLLSLLIKKHIPRKEIQLSILSLEGGEIEKSEHLTIVKKIKLDDLLTDNHTFKIARYLILDAQGQHLTDHYVIIKDNFKGPGGLATLSIMEPAAPEISLHMTAENMTIDQELNAIQLKPVEEELNQIYEQSFRQKYKLVIQSIFTLNIK